MFPQVSEKMCVGAKCKNGFHELGLYYGWKWNAHSRCLKIEYQCKVNHRVITSYSASCLVRYNTDTQEGFFCVSIMCVNYVERVTSSCGGVFAIITQENWLSPVSGIAYSIGWSLNVNPSSASMYSSCDSLSSDDLTQLSPPPTLLLPLPRTQLLNFS